MRRRRIHHGTSRATMLIILVVLGVAVWIGNDVLIEYEAERPSRSHGTRVDGKLKFGKRLPSTGPNFQTYSRLMSTIGRTCVHEKVRAAVVTGYAYAYAEDESLQFVFGETGWCGGGEFKPHRTHQNGLSVDFMVPVRRNGKIDTLPTTIIDGFGYRVEFDEKGMFGEYEIDYAAMVVHLNALRKSAEENGLEIDRVIFDPELQKQLRKTRGGKKLTKKLEFNKDPAWIRHDEHYHVDFRLKEGTQNETRGFDNSVGEPVDREPAPRQDWDAF